MSVITPQALILPYILRSIDRLLETAQGLPVEKLAVRPHAQASSLATLVAHTISNLEDNLLGTVAGMRLAYDRDRDFAEPPTTQDALILRWAEVRSRLDATATALLERRWDEVIQHPRRGELTVLEVFVVVARHAAEHLAEAELTAVMLRAS